MTWTPTPKASIETTEDLLVRFHDNSAKDIGADDMRHAVQALSSVDATKRNKHQVGDRLMPTPLNLGVLRSMEYDVAYPLPVKATPHMAGIPAILKTETNDLSFAGLSLMQLGYQAKDAYIIRWSPDTWVLTGRKWQGSPMQDPFWLILVADAADPDGTLVGIGTVRFHSDSEAISDEIGDIASLGAVTLAHHIVGLEKRIQSLEHHSTNHATVSPAEFTLVGAIKGGMMLDFAGNDDVLFDEHEHIVTLTWSGGVKPSFAGIGAVIISGTTPDKMGGVRFIGDRMVTPSMAASWVEHGSHVTVQWLAAVHQFQFVKVQQVAITGSGT